MATSTLYSLTLTDLQGFANDCKEATFSMLIDEGLLNGDVDALCLEYHIILYRKGVLGRALDRLTGKGEDGFSMLTMKTVRKKSAVEGGGDA